MAFTSERESWPVFVQSVLLRIENELPARFTYHDLGHTLEVIRAALVLSERAELSPRDTELLLIAAAFHDAGFLTNPASHEAASAEMVAAAMQLEGRYTQEEISLVARMVLDTKAGRENGSLHWIATTRLSPYLLDADLAHLGSATLNERSEKLYQELGGPDRTELEARTVSLLTSHRWKTPQAAQLWDSIKQRNLDALRKSPRPQLTRITPVATQSK